MRQPESAVSGDCPSSVEDFRDTVGWDVQSPREFGSAHAEFFQFFRKVLAWMNRCYSHGHHLVIVHNLNIRRPGSGRRPFKADAPLIVDSNAVLASPVPFQRFEMVSGQRCEIAQRSRCFEPIQFQACGALYAEKCLNPLARREISGALVPTTGDHASISLGSICVT